MDEQGFRQYLRRGGRSPSAVERCVRYTASFQHFLDEQGPGMDLDEAGGEELEAFVAWLESGVEASAKTHLWALRYYYDFAGKGAMSRLAASLRRQRIQRRPFGLESFRGVDPGHIARLRREGIRNVDQMLEAGRKQSQREGLASRTGIPASSILELVKLSDLARIPGIKGARARLYYDAGVDTIAKLAGWEAGQLEAMLSDYVESSNFDGVAPLPKEVAFSITTARSLNIALEF